MCINALFGFCEHDKSYLYGYSIDMDFYLLSHLHKEKVHFVCLCFIL